MRCFASYIIMRVVSAPKRIHPNEYLNMVSKFTQLEGFIFGTVASVIYGIAYWITTLLF